MISRHGRLITLISLPVIAMAFFTLPAFSIGGDGTGPLGQGPLTGRGAGYCAGYSTPGYLNRDVGRGGVWRTGVRGGGRGNRNFFNTTGLARWQRSADLQTAAPAQPGVSREQRLQQMRTRADILKAQMESLNNQIKAVESADD